MLTRHIFTRHVSFKEKLWQAQMNEALKDRADYKLNKADRIDWEFLGICLTALSFVLVYLAAIWLAQQ